MKENIWEKYDVHMENKTCNENNSIEEMFEDICESDECSSVEKNETNICKLPNNYEIGSFGQDGYIEPVRKPNNGGWKSNTSFKQLKEYSLIDIILTSITLLMILYVIINFEAISIAICKVILAIICNVLNFIIFVGTIVGGGYLAFNKGRNRRWRNYR